MAGNKNEQKKQCVFTEFTYMWVKDQKRVVWLLSTLLLRFCKPKDSKRFNATLVQILVEYVIVLY